MKRFSIILALLGMMLAIPFVYTSTVADADADHEKGIQEAPIIKQSMSVRKGQIWTLAGERVTNGLFVVSKVDLVNGAVVVQGHIEGLLKDTKTAKSYVADLPPITVSLGAFNRSVVQLVGEKLPTEAEEAEFAAWQSAGGHVSSLTVNELVSRQFS